MNHKEVLPTVELRLVGKTNGDMVKALLPKYICCESKKHNIVQMCLYVDNNSFNELINLIEFDLDWWNSPYEEE